MSNLLGDIVRDWKASHPSVRRAFCTTGGYTNGYCGCVWVVCDDDSEQYLSDLRRQISAAGIIAAVVRIAEGEMVNGWPPIEPMTAEEVAQARAEYAAGDYLELDEAFAEIAGVSVEEWRKGVAERRRQNSEQP